MRRAWARVAAALAGAFVAAASTFATPQAAPAADSCAFAGPALTTVRASILLRGRPLAYVAHAGLLPIRDDTGQTRGCMFFSAYQVPARQGAAPRPLSFIWNGGPGANALALHLEAFGPRRVSSAASPTEPPPAQLRLEDNQATLLDASDLVFVDPIGTGFSRASTRADDARFFSTLGDAASVAQFVRSYLARFGGSARPVFLIGESYGTWRAEAVAAALGRAGQPVRGVALISGGLPIGQPEPEPDYDGLSLPNRTAAALFHGKLGPALQAEPAATLKASAAWAEAEYSPALAHRDTLSDAQRQAIYDGVRRFSGLAPDPQTLVVSRHAFLTDLTGLPLNPLDMRLSASAPPDPRRAPLIGDYLRRALGFDTRLTYQGLEPPQGSDDVTEQAINEGWVYDQGAKTISASDPSLAHADGPPGGTPDWLPQAFRAIPSLKVFVATGLFDSYSSCLRMRAIAARLPAAWRGRIGFGCYAAGHMIYRDQGPREQLADDLRRFIETPVPEPRR